MADQKIVSEDALSAIASDIKTAISAKADSSDVYNKSYIDTALASKADSADTYTKEEVDEKVAEVATTGEVSGAIASFNTDIAEPYQSVLVNVLATGGNGTPDNPIPINGYTEANITRCGVNLFDKTNASAIIIGYIWATQIVYAQNMRTVFAKCKPSTLYTISKMSGQRFIVGYSKELPDIDVEVFGAITDNTATHISITTGADAKYIVAFVFNGNVDSGTAEEMLASVQIAEGTDTTYHSYTGNTYTIAFGQTVYGGVLDVTRGKLTVDFLEFDLGTLTPVMYTVTEGNLFRYALDDLKPLASDYDITKIICSNYPSVPSASRTDKTLSQVSNLLRFDIIDNDYNDVASMKTAMNGVQVVYPLDTPFDIDLTPVQISALVGTNNVYSDTGSTDVVFLKKTGIDDLTDVEITSPTNGQILKYDGSKWINASGGGVSYALDDLTDVGISTPTNGQTLIYNGATWENANAWIDVTGTLTAGNTSITLSNAAISSSSTIDVYTDTFGVNPTAITVSSGSITLTFAEQASDVSVKVRIS